MTKMIVTVLATLSLSVLAHANDHKGACKKLTAACEAGGFKKGAHKEAKGLHKDCMAKLLAGETVAGVTVAAEDVTACKEKHDKKAAHKAKTDAPAATH